MGNLCPQFYPSSSSRLRYLIKKALNSPDTVSLQPETNSSLQSFQSENNLKQLNGQTVIREYVNFPFLVNNELASWIVNTRFMFILRGPPGSGKSYISECLKLRYPTAKVCSADEFWYLESNGAEYQFDVRRLNEAHEWCQTKAYDAACEGQSPIVIDNTNIRIWETRFYTDLARRFHYTVIVVTPQTPWRFDTEALATRNVHFVSLETIESKVRNFEHLFPLYYGWFWPGFSSCHDVNTETRTTNSTRLRNLNMDGIASSRIVQHLLAWGWDAVTTILGLPEVYSELVKRFALSADDTIQKVLEHWQSATIPDFGIGLQSSCFASRPHVTANYVRYGKMRGAEKYALSKAVSDGLLGCLSTIQITGLFLTSRTIGAKVQLPLDDPIVKHLWASDDQVFLENGQHPNTDHSNQPFDNIPKVTRPTGCRAHITFALAPDVPAVETGLDLLRIVDKELMGHSGEFLATVKSGSVRRVSINKSKTRFVYPNPDSDVTQSPLEMELEFAYVLDLDFPQSHRVLFSGSY